MYRKIEVIFEKGKRHICPFCDNHLTSDVWVVGAGRHRCCVKCKVKWSGLYFDNDLTDVILMEKDVYGQPELSLLVMNVKGIFKDGVL